MKRYISYLMNACLRKISLWILTAVYMFILVAFSIIVPLVANSPLLVPWTTDMKVTQLCLIILSAIFSAIMAVYIFREAQEDGTELLICSKPLERKKMIASKFICFGLLLVMFSILPVLILLFAYIVPQNSIMAVTWLIVGLICGNLVSMLVFGAVAALFSLAFTKVVVIVANVSLIIVLAIYSTVTIATAQSPLGKMLNSRKYAATQIVYFDNDNNAKGSSYILPTSTDIEEMLKVATIQGQKNIWQQYVDESPNNIINGFDIVNHLATVYFAGGLEQAWYNLNQGMGIGTSKNANYKITTTVNHEPQDQVSPEQTAIDIKPLIVNDDDPYWTNLYRKDSAKTWIDVSNVSRTQTYNFLDANKSQGEEIIRKLVQTVRYYIQLALTYSICSMTTSSIAAPADCRFFYDVSKQDAIDTYVVAGFYDGQNVIKNLKQQNWQNLEPTEDEIDFFNYALYKILFTNEYYADVNPNPDYAIWNDEIKTDTWEIQMVNETSEANSRINKVFYEDIYLNSPKAIELLHLNSNEDIAKEIMRFKYYASKKLTAAAGTNNYDVINYQDENGSSIVVPWDAYFKCVFNTQFNSMNVANESEFNDLIGKAVVGQGFLPINNYYRQDTNLLNTFCLRPRYKSVQNEDVGINRLTTVYNGLQYGRGQNQQKPGSADPAQNVSEDIFVAYDFTADPKNADNWTNYATIKDKNQNPVYGYTSKLGMMASEFLNDYVCGENNSVYTDDGFIEEYNSTLYHSSTPYYVFTNILFNYDMTEQFSPGIYAAIYLCIALVLMAVAYTRYIRYDFK